MYELVTNKFGEKDSETFVHLIEEKMDTKIDQRTQLLATKDDIAALRLSTKDEISAVRLEISALRLSTKDDISSLRKEMSADMITLKAELLRTIYLTSISQLVAIVTAVISLVLLLKK